MQEPRLPAELEHAKEFENSEEYYPKALRALAAQLGVGNDFYFPLIGAAGMIERDHG